MRHGRELPSETTEERVASKANPQLGQMKISCEVGEPLPQRAGLHPATELKGFDLEAMLPKILKRIKVPAH